MPKIKVNGQEIYYEMHGTQQVVPLVLIAGLGQDHTFWTSILDSLAKTQQVLIFDNRGIGQSSVPDVAYTIKDMAYDLNALLEALDIPLVNIVGASMGGLIAQEFALHCSHKLQSLILYSTFAKIGIRTQKILLNTAKFFELGDLDATLNSILTNAYGDDFLADSKRVQERLEAMKNNPYPQTSQGFWGQFGASCAFDSRDCLGKIQQPTLIVAGRRDILSMQEEAEELLRIPASTLVTIPRVAHVAHIENPGYFLDQVLGFLSV